jgi:hypothetical protein
MELLILVFQLVIGHAVGDFVLQPPAMSRGKNPRNDLKAEFGEGFPGWQYWLGAHALTHAGIVYLITGSALLALLETILHAAIDLGKCLKRYSIHTDQLLHAITKVLYCGLIYAGLG